MGACGSNEDITTEQNRKMANAFDKTRTSLEDVLD